VTEAEPLIIDESGLRLALEVLAQHENEMQRLQDKTKELKTYVESCFVTLDLPQYRHAGYNIFWRDNSASHHMNWARLRKERESLYKFLLAERIARITMPIREKSLVFTHSGVANP